MSDKQNHIIDSEYISGPLYISLDSAVREIRLLQLHPGEFKADIACSFIHGSIGHLVPYEALSYVWGSQDHKMPVMLSGHNRHVTPNLAAALRSLRSETESRTLWIDQLCINQEDDNERASQVGLMKDIYEGAASVVVWLGESTPGSETVLDFLAHVNPAQLEDAAIALQAMQIPGMREWTRTAIGIIFFNPWWQRVWIIQEILYARNAVVVCGTQSAPWRSVSATIGAIWLYCSDLVDEVAGDMGRREPKAFIWQRLELVRQRIQGDKRGIKAWQLILYFRYCQSTRPEDRIYALLGLCSDIKEEGFEVDYKRSHHDTFTLFTKHMIETDRSLRWLSHAGSEEFLTTQPSWCPCFDLPAGIVPDTILSSMNMFNADDSAEFSATISLTSPVLSAKGMQIDRLDKFCHGFEDIFGECLKTQHDDSARILSLDRAQARYGQSLQLALEKCLTADRGIDDEGQITRFKLDGSYPQVLAALKTTADRKPLPAEVHTPWQNRMMTLISSTLMNRALFVSETGWVGLVPRWAKPGDLICILFGCKVPVILRGQQGHYEYIGESYVVGLMDGEYSTVLENSSSASTSCFEIY